MGALVGVGAATGLLLVAASLIGARTPTLEERVVPYLPDGRRQAPSTYLAALGESRWGLDRGVKAAARLVDRLAGGRRSVAWRLDAVSDGRAVDQFRADQAIAGGLGLLAGVLLATLMSITTGSVAAMSGLVLGATGLVLGVLAPDWRLTRRVRQRETDIAAELPVVAEILALAVAAGEGVLGAMDRVEKSCGGVLSQEFRRVLVDVGSGTRLADALQLMAGRTRSPHVSRLSDAVVVAMDRGTPLAGVLRQQAADVSAARRRELLEEGGRRSIAMLAPVVFMILPVTVLFAVYPGLVSIVQLAQ
jgi:tight adherence protein C